MILLLVIYVFNLIFKKIIIYAMYQKSESYVASYSILNLL